MLSVVAFQYFSRFRRAGCTGCAGSTLLERLEAGSTGVLHCPARSPGKYGVMASGPRCAWRKGALAADRLRTANAPSAEQPAATQFIVGLLKTSAGCGAGPRQGSKA